MVQIILYSSFILAFIIYVFCRRRSNFPPGPWPLPFIGNLMQLGKYSHYALSKCSKIYGPIVGFQSGPFSCICVHSAKLIKEAFNEPAFTGRHHNESVEFVLGEPGGIVNSVGDVWVEQRRFVLRHLRDFGFGKSSMEELIMDEVRDVIDWLKKQNGKAVPLQRRFALAVVNSLWRILTGERIDHDDTKLHDILDGLGHTADVIFGLESWKGFILLFYSNVAKKFPNWSGWNRLQSIKERRDQLFRDIISEHFTTLPEDNPRDFVDLYLQEVNRSTNPNSSFHPRIGHESLKRVMSDLFLAGTDTTSVTLSWTMLYLLHYPEVQKKLHEELDREVGRSRHPCISDNLPYTEAVVLETLRFSSIAPTSVAHYSTKDVKFHGYDIPKGTLIFANLHDAHFDSEVWGDPEVFRPERFLSTDGTTLQKQEGLLIPFSVGRRVCVGETLARDTLFLFVANLAHNFEVVIPPGVEKPPLKFIRQLTLAPISSTVALKERYQID